MTKYVINPFTGKLDANDGAGGGGTGNVNSTGTITDNSLVRGDGGTRNIQDSGILVDDSDNITAAESLQLNLGGSVNEFSTDGTLSGDSDSAVPTEKAVKTYVDGGNTFDENGFVDPGNDVQISFVNGTRTFTISPQAASFTYWSEGIKYTKSGSENIVIDDTEGDVYIYYDGSALTKSTTWSLDYILKYAFVAIIYWDATNNEQVYIGDEFQHTTKMGSKTHQYLHDTRGFSLEAGGGLTDILEDESGDLDSHAEFGVEATVAYDEDAEFSHSSSGSTATVYLYYKTGTEASPSWRLDDDDSFGVITTGTGRAAYNQLTGGNWQQTEVPNNDFVLAHVLTFNDSTRKFGVIQGENSYSTIISARDGAESEIVDITIDGLIGPEIKFLGTLIYQTSTGYGNTVKSRIRSVNVAGDDYIDLRDFGITRGGVSGTLTDHGALTGLGDDDHPQYLIADSLPDAIFGGEAVNHEVNTTTAFAPVSYEDLGTVEFKVRSFDDTAEEYMQGTFTVPDDLYTSGTVTFEVHGFAATAVAAKNVQFTFGYRVIGDSDAIDGAYSDDDSGDLLVDSTQDDLDILSWTETVSNLSLVAGKKVAYRFSRIDATSDDLSGDYNVWTFLIRVPRA